MSKPLVRCKRCPMPTTRPDTAFVDGVCSACLAYEARNLIDWGKRKEDLLRILESLKPNRDGYAIVVPSSGGKDSTSQVLTLLELGVKPLVVTASTCMLTETGRRNIDNLARYATTIEVTPNRRVRAMLNRLGLELVGDISWPEHLSIFSAPWRIARDFGISAIMYGENPQNAYGGPMDTLDAYKMDRRWIAEFGGHLGMRADDMVGAHGLTREDMADYQMPMAEEMAGISAYFLGAFLPWNSHQNAKAAIGAGMQTREHGRAPSIANWWTAENLDNAQTGIHDYFGALKFGYGRLCAQISVDVRYGMMSRAEAIEIVRDSDCMFPAEYMDVHWFKVLEQIGLTRDRFIELANDYANRNLWDMQMGDLPQIKCAEWMASFEHEAVAA